MVLEPPVPELAQVVALHLAAEHREVRGAEVVEVGARVGGSAPWPHRSWSGRAAFCSANSTSGWRSWTRMPASAKRSAAARSIVAYSESITTPSSSNHTPTSRSPSDRSSAGGSSSRHATARSGSGPASTDNKRSRSSAQRAIGPNTLMSTSMVPPLGVVEIPTLGDHTPRGLEPVDAAAVRRDPHRAADVGPDLEAGEPRGDRGGRPAGRPAGDAIERPRVVRHAEELVVGLHVARPPRQVGLAEHDGAGGLEAGDGGCVLGGHVVGELLGAARRADALGRRSRP